MSGATPPGGQRAAPDRIFLRDLVVAMEIGAYASEKGRKQRVRFSVEAEIVPVDNPRHDDLRDIVSYDLLADAVRAASSGGHVALVETVAETIAGTVLANDRIASVTVTVEKLDLGPHVAGITIVRQRPETA